MIVEGNRARQFLEVIGMPVRLSQVRIAAVGLEAIADGVVRVSFGAGGKLACNPPVSRGARRFGLGLGREERILSAVNALGGGVVEI